MEHQDIIKCLHFIRPNAKWKLVGEVLEWQDDQQDEPTESEIKKGWADYEAQVEADKAQQAAKKAAAEAKLAALGLDADDLKVLGLG